MNSARYSLCTRVVLFISFLFLFSNINAQCNAEEGGASCQEAPLVCLNNLCDATEDNQPDGPYNGWCGPNTAIHNPQYFEFIATSTDVFFEVTVGDCSGGQSALQAAILNACPWQGANNVLDCTPGTPQGGTFTLQASGLVIGQSYWLVFDGSAGSECDYTINIATGIYEPVLENDLETVSANPTSVCQGYNDLQLTAEPEAVGAHGYWWVPSWAPNDTTETTDPFISMQIPANLSAGFYEICVRAFSGCDTMDFEICVDIEVFEIPDEIKDPAIFCEEEFPFQWGSVNINGPGQYFQNFTTAEGCSFDSSWVVQMYPIIPLGLLDTLHCQESLFYEGNSYDSPGTYDLFYPGGGLNGCDSSAELTVVLADLDAFLDLDCENGEFVLSVLIQELIPFSAQVEYEWYESGILISTDIKLYVLDGGVFDVIVQVITSAGVCEFALPTFAFNAEDYRPDPPNMGFVDTLICAQSGVFFEVIEDPFGDPLTYVWSTVDNVPIFQDGSNIAEFDFTNSGPSTICVYAINECGPGPETCFTVDIKPAPVASFTYEPMVCADSTTVITFTGNANPTSIVTWSFNNPSTIVGSGLGPYTLSWGVPGNKTVSVQVIEPGCDTAFFSQVITISTLQTPVVNCSSTLSSVTFDWADVAGSSGYLVSINAGPAMPSDTSTWTESGLAPGTVVNMTLTIISAGPCPDIIINAMCTAVNCPPPTIVITGQDSACLNNPTIIDLNVTVDGMSDNGVWTGPGIIDAMLGLFDPVLATSGQHQVSYTTMATGCPFTETYMITVFDSITANFTLDPVICITDQATLTYTGNAIAPAVFNYNFGTATVVSGSGAGPYQLSWAGTGQKTVRLQITENGCTSNLISHTTDVGATLNAPTINCTPNTSGIIFSWVTDPAAASYAVNTLVGPVGTPIGTDSLEFAGLNPGDPVQIEIITMSAGPCPDRRDTLECIARDCPMPVITITPVSNICLYPGTGTVNLQVSVVNGNGTGGWSGTGVTDPVNGVFNPVTAGAGAHQISYNYTDDGCNFVNSITIRVYDQPEALISNTDLMITCLAGSIFLDGSSSSGGPLSYRWTTTNGVIAGGSNTAMAEATAQGVYQLLVTNTVSGCVDSVSVMVTQDANIPTANAGLDKKITCDSLQFTLGGNSTMGVNIIYSWSTPNGSIIGASNGRFIQADADGTYNILVRDTSNGCQSTDQVLIGMDTVVATIILTPGDTIDCNTPITTALAMLSGPVANYDLNWSTLDGKIEGSTSGASVNVSQGGTYTLTILSKLNGCMNSEDVVIEESNEIINGVEVSLMNIDCNGDNNGALTVNNVSGGTAPYNYQWSGTSQSGTMLTTLGPGLYTLTVSDGNGCSYVESYQITEPDLVTLDIGPDRTVNVDDSVSLNINTNLTGAGIGTIVWSEYDGISCPGCPTFAFKAVSSATMFAMISDTSGCEAIDSMRLRVLVPRVYYIPNVFSPNGDGLNDFFYVTGKANLTNVVYLRIFDRWGNQLFGKTDMIPGDEAAGWDGKFDGKYLLPGVYVYVTELDFEGIKETISGDITILR